MEIINNNSPYKQFIGKICYGFFKTGKSFAAKLLEIQGDILIFENSKGYKFVNRSSELAGLSELPQGV